MNNNENENKNTKKKKEHFKIIRFMFEAATKLGITSVTLSTAATLFHRFCQNIQTDQMDLHTIATTMLYLASKVEEEHLRLRDVINVTHRILHPVEDKLEIDSFYWAIRDSVIQTELYIVRVLKFQVDVDHPLKYLMHHLKSLFDWLDKEITQSVPIAHRSWALLMDSYHSGEICLGVEPELLSVSILYMVLKIFGVKVPFMEEERVQIFWWQALVDNVRLKDIEAVCLQLMSIYDEELKIS